VGGEEEGEGSAAGEEGRDEVGRRARRRGKGAGGGGDARGRRRGGG
jgi:hypothetical protein